MEATLIKSGEQCMQVVIRRSPAGVTVQVKTHPLVEDFIRGMGDGSRVDVRTLGRYWTPVPHDKVHPENDKPLLIYNIQKDPGVLQTKSGYYFHLIKPGWPLVEGAGLEEGGILDGSRGPTVNMSFLRLAGTSEGDGVTFGIRGVFTLPALKRLEELMGEAQERFYVNYMKPVEFVVTVIRQEVTVPTVVQEEVRRSSYGPQLPPATGGLVASEAEGNPF